MVVRLIVPGVGAVLERLSSYRHTSSWLRRRAAVSSECHIKIAATFIRYQSVGCPMTSCLMSHHYWRIRYSSVQQCFGETDGQYAARRASKDWTVTGIRIRKTCLKLPLTDRQYYTWKPSYLKGNTEKSSLFYMRRRNQGNMEVTRTDG